MAKNTNLTVEKRDFSVSPKQLRAEGKVTATIYGHNFDAVSIQLDAKTFLSVCGKDKTSVFELKNGKETYNVLVKNVQYHSTKDQVLNIEFYMIKTDEKLKVSVPVAIVGESPAVKAGGKLWNPLAEIDVECLPKNIPSKIEVNISCLKNIDETITVGDVKYPSGVSPISAMDTLVVRVNNPAGKEEVAPVESEEVAELTKS